MDSAIDSRTSVGLIGLATAAWAGLGWMANLREALSQMWGLQRGEPPGFVRTKLSDLVALLSAFVAIVVTVALTALGNGSVMRTVLEWLGHARLPGAGCAAARRVAGGVAVVSRGCCSPGSSPGCRGSRSASAARRGPGLLAAVAFEIFKQVASVYLSSVLQGPGGRHLRPRARPDGVRLHHRAADPLRDGVGGDVAGQSRRRAGRPARPRRSITTRVRGARRARRRRRARRGGGGCPWCAWAFRA